MQQQHFVLLARKALGRVEAKSGVVAGADPPEILGYQKIVRQEAKLSLG